MYYNRCIPRNHVIYRTYRTSTVHNASGGSTVYTCLGRRRAKGHETIRDRRLRQLFYVSNEGLQQGVDTLHRSKCPVYDSRANCCCTSGRGRVGGAIYELGNLIARISGTEANLLFTSVFPTSVGIRVAMQISKNSTYNGS